MVNLKPSKLEILLNLYSKYFKPKFYNKVTWFVVFAGVSILATPLIERIFEHLFEIVFNFDPTNGNSSLVGIALVAIGLIYNIVIQYIDSFVNRYELKEEREKQISHDLNNFERLHTLLPEKTFMGIVDFIATNHLYKTNQKRQLDNYLSTAREIQYEFEIEEINTANAIFLDVLSNFSNFLSFHFFHGKNMNSREFLYLYPDLNVDRGGDPNLWNPSLYDEKADELNQLSVSAEKSYREFRRAVKKNLHY